MSQKMSFVNIGNKWFLMSQKMSFFNVAANESFFSVAKDDLFTSKKLEVFDVIINGFLMLQKRSTLMSQKTEYIKVAKINYFNL